MCAKHNSVLALYKIVRTSCSDEAQKWIEANDVDFCFLKRISFSLVQFPYSNFEPMRGNNYLWKVVITIPTLRNYRCTRHQNNELTRFHFSTPASFQRNGPKPKYFRENVPCLWCSFLRLHLRRRKALSSSKSLIIMSMMKSLH